MKKFNPNNRIIKTKEVSNLFLMMLIEKKNLLMKKADTNNYFFI